MELPQTCKRDFEYIALVRPKLKHACAAWDLYMKKEIAALEGIQRKAVRFCLQNYSR